MCILLLHQAMAAVPRYYQVGIYFLNEDGKYDGKLQEEWEAELSRLDLTKSGVTFLSPSKILNPAITRVIDQERQKSLLEFPELLFNSSFARRLMCVDALLTVYISQKKGLYYLSATLGEIGTRSLTYLLVQTPKEEEVRDEEEDLPAIRRRSWTTTSVKSPRRDAALESLFQEIRNVLKPDEPKVKVLLNLDSRICHAEKCGHISTEARVESCDSLQEATAMGYRPCPICFPENNRLLKQDELEMALSREIAGAIEYYYRASRNQEYADRVRRVGTRIVETNKLNDFNFIFNVVDSDEINAFAAPAGPVYVTEGLLRVLESDDELAGVISHEIGHVTNHHAVRQYRQAQNFELLGFLVGIATRSNVGAAMTDFIGSLISRGYDRNFELEADRDALVLTAVSGFRPEELVVAFKKLEDLGKQMPSRVPGWLSTHPEMSRRIGESKPLLEKLSSFLRIISSIGSMDEKLAGYIRSHPSRYLERLQSLEMFAGTLSLLNLRPPARSRSKSNPLE